MSIPSEHEHSDRAYRWGIIGTGKISQDFVTAITFQSNVIVSCVGSRDLRSAKDFCDKYKVNKAYGDYESVCEDSEVDIVYIGTLHPNHYNNLLLAIHHKKHVLCEKPITINAAQAKIVFEEAKKNNVLVMEAAWHRFQPWCVKLRQLLEEKTIGDIHLVEADFGVKFSPDNRRIRDPMMGGGSLLDVGCYPVNIANMIYNGDKPSKILASGELNSEGVDNQVAAILDYGQNRMAILSSASIVETGKELRIFGSKGHIKVSDHFSWHCSTRLVLKLDADKTEQLFTFKLPESQHQAKFNFIHSSMLVYEAIEMEKLVANNQIQSNIQPWKDTITNMETLDQIRAIIGVKYPQQVESTEKTAINTPNKKNT